MINRSAILIFSLPFLAGAGFIWVIGGAWDYFPSGLEHRMPKGETGRTAKPSPGGSDGSNLPASCLPAEGKNVSEAVDRIRALRDRGGRLDLALANVLIAGAASRDPLRVLEFLLEPASNSLRRSCLPTLLNVWVAADSQGAIDKILSLKKSADRTELEYRLLNALAEQAPERALEILKKNPPLSGDNFNTVSLYFEAFLNWGIRNPREAEAGISEIQDPDRREQALGGLARAHARLGFHDALAWLEGSSLDEKCRTEARNIIFQEGLRSDGHAAMDELRSLMMAKTNTDGIAIFNQNQWSLIALDPRRALDLLMSSPASDEAFHSTLESFFEGLARSRPADATEIINGFLADPVTLAKIYEAGNTSDDHHLIRISHSLAYASAMVDDTKGFEALSSRSLGWDSERYVMSKLMAVDPGHVASIYLERGLSDLQSLIRTWSATDPASAAAWVEDNVKDPAWCADIKSSLEEDDASRHPQQYSKALLERGDTPGNRKLAGCIAHSLAYTSPADAAEWAQQIQNPELFKVAVISISSLWLDQDSVQASEWISKLPTGAARDAAIRKLIEAVEPKDPASAQQWKRMLEAPEIQRDASHE